MAAEMAQPEFVNTRTGEMIGGRYLVGPRLGKGGHGEVYRARDVIDQCDVAIKFLAPHLAADSDYRLRLVREARAMATLQDLSTIRIMGVIGSDDGTPCVVMELLEGMDLLQALQERERGFELAEIVAMFMPVVATLDAAHARGITHRDIKPSNIFLVDGQPGNSRIMDFGLAKADDLTSITADRMLAGSPSYIAPEVWQNGARAADRRSDVYSLACVIYQAVTGEVPIYRENLAHMLVAVTTEPRPSICALRSDLPASADDWVQQALAIDPADRFQTVVAMWRAFRGAFEC